MAHQAGALKIDGESMSWDSEATVEMLQRDVFMLPSQDLRA